MNVSSMNLISTRGFKHEKPIVIFDIAHQQHFNHTHMQEALQLVEGEYGIDIYLNRENFTLTNLRGADLLILPSPYYKLPAVDIATTFDTQVLIEFLVDGGAILFLSNPFFFEENMRNYSGNNKAMNRFMNIGIGMEFIGTENVLMNDFSHQFNDERFLSLNSTHLKSEHAIITGFPEDEPVKELLAYSTGISAQAGELIVNTPPTTYQVSSEGDLIQGSINNQTILGSSSSGGSGRVIACGSSIMFSDLVIPSTNSTRWIDVKDNKQLFRNMISWLLFETPVPEEENYIPDFSLFALATSVLFLLTLVLGIILYTIGREVKRVEVSEKIIKMREQRAQREKIDKEIQEALYAEDFPEEDKKEEKEEEEEIGEDEIDMEDISKEIRKKSKTRSRSERRRRRRK